jgi:excisionase family DNA binding protein
MGRTLVALDGSVKSADSYPEAQAVGETTAVRKLAYSPDQAYAALAIGRTVLFELLRRNEIASVKIGRRRVIPAASLEAYMNRLITEQAERPA